MRRTRRLSIRTGPLRVEELVPADLLVVSSGFLLHTFGRSEIGERGVLIIP